MTEDEIKMLERIMVSNTAMQIQAAKIRELEAIIEAKDNQLRQLIDERTGLVSEIEAFERQFPTKREHIQRDPI